MVGPRVLFISAGHLESITQDTLASEMPSSSAIEGEDQCESETLFTEPIFRTKKDF